MLSNLCRNSLFLVGTIAFAAHAAALITSSNDPSNFDLVAEDFAFAENVSPSITSLSGNVSLVTVGEGQPPSGPLWYKEWTSELPGNEFAINGDESFDVVFSSLQSAFAFNFVDESVTSFFSLDFYNGLSNVGSAAFTSTIFNQALFFGYASDLQFDKVEIREIDGAGNNSNEYFQFFTVKAVPDTTSTIALFGLGLAGFVVLRRRIG